MAKVGLAVAVPEVSVPVPIELPLLRKLTVPVAAVGETEAVRVTLLPAVTDDPDVVSVVVQTEETRYGERVIGYQATLTYFYRNPDLQMGEYCRMFDGEREANVWANSYKGRNVPVRVDPRDSSSSVLLPSDLDSLIPTVSATS